MDTGMLLVVGGLMVTYFLCREAVCWYNKVNERVALLKEILKVLKRIDSGTREVKVPVEVVADIVHEAAPKKEYSPVFR
jgi:hypothetical protein